MSFLTPESQIALLILLFFAGLAGRRGGWLTPAHAGKMLQVVMYVGLPALFLADVSRVPLDAQALLLPVLSIAMILGTWGLATLVGGRLQLNRQSFGAFVLCAMALNNALLFPFILAGWGREAFALLALVDLGNAVMVCTVYYAVAAYYGGHATTAAAIVRRTLTFPPLWALTVALLVNVSGWRFPAAASQVLSTTGRLVLLLVILALGILFDAKRIVSRAVLTAVTLRIVAGFAIGYALVELAGLEGLARQVMLLGAAAPIGFNVVVLANRESLDRELAASAASLAVLLGLAYVPLLLWLLR